MIETQTGDILQADAEALVNTVNCVGVMGRGLALQFKKAYPLNFKAYETACTRREVRPGQMFVFETCQLTNPKYIVNFPTKRHWLDKSRMRTSKQGSRRLRMKSKRGAFAQSRFRHSAAAWAGSSGMTCALGSRGHSAASMMCGSAFSSRMRLRLERSQEAVASISCTRRSLRCRSAAAFWRPCRNSGPRSRV